MKTGSYRPQLDGLRAAAVLGVVFQHFTPEAWSRVFPLGGLGVTLFFILSGYLITGILLKGRETVEASKISASDFLRAFYARRALRILPVYYVTLAFAALLAISPVRESILWHALYLSNVYFALAHSYCGAISQFWSLAVEQHFYLLWPWMVLFTPKRWLMPVFGLTILSGVIFHAVGLVAGWNTIAVNVLTPTAFEPLGSGALLACLEHQTRRKSHLLLPFALFWVAFLPLTLWLCRLESCSAGQMIVKSLPWTVFFVWLVAGAAKGFRSWGGRCLQSSPARYLGKISYGIYLLHNLVISRITLRADHLFFGLRAIAAFGVTLILAAISYEYLEAPVRDLKRFFPYGTRAIPKPVPQLEEQPMAAVHA